MGSLKKQYVRSTYRNGSSVVGVIISEGQQRVYYQQHVYIIYQLITGKLIWFVWSIFCLRHNPWFPVILGSVVILGFQWLSLQPVVVRGFSRSRQWLSKSMVSSGYLGSPSGYPEFILVSILVWLSRWLSWFPVVIFGFQWLSWFPVVILVSSGYLGFQVLSLVSSGYLGFQWYKP